MTSTTLANKAPAPQEFAVEVRAISKHYGSLHAVDGVDLPDDAGEHALMDGEMLFQALNLDDGCAHALSPSN